MIERSFLVYPHKPCSSANACGNSANRRSSAKATSSTEPVSSAATRLASRTVIPSRQSRTLEKYARALGVPLYRLFIEDDETPRKPKVSLTESAEPTWGAKENERRELSRFAKALSRMDDQRRKLLLAMATRMAGRRGRPSSRSMPS